MFSEQFSVSGGRFSKYQALGNDMAVIDPAACAISMTPENIRLICDRHFGVGADGICYGPLPDAPLPNTMRFFNPDGSEAEKSGNGLRVFARYLWDAGIVTDSPFPISINGETLAARVLDASARRMAIEMGRLAFTAVNHPMTFNEQTFPVTAVSIGNPHCVIVTEQLEQIHTLGPLIETAPQFPQRTNVQLIKIIDRHNIQIEIWERGAGYTLASGSSSSAAAGTAVRLGRCASPITVHMPGGAAQVFIDEAWRVELVGEVTAVYQAAFAPDLFKQLLLSERHSELETAYRQMSQEEKQEAEALKRIETTIQDVSDNPQ